MTKTQGKKITRLPLCYQRALRAILAETLGYPIPDGRRFAQLKTRKFNPGKADWTQSNIALARKWKVTRQRVLAIRKQLGHPKVESRGRKAKHV